MSDDEIDSFRNVTGCQSGDEAKHFLEACNGDLQRAVDLYFNRSINPFESSEQPGPSSRQLTARTSRTEPNNDEMDDDIIVEHSVRAPIAPVSGQIVEQSFGQQRRNWRAGAFSAFNQINGHSQIAQEQRAQLLRQMSDNRREMSAHTATNRSTRESSTSSKRNLVSLFRPPVDLMFNHDWDSTLKEAINRRVWLLVNVQKPDEFACQVLNRDVWSDGTVKEIVRSNFLFWQVQHNAPDGVRICGYYSLNDFPAIFIVDPRTGEKVMSLRAPDPVAFLDQLTTFLDKYPTAQARDEEIEMEYAKPIAASDTHEINISKENSSKKRKQTSSPVLFEDMPDISIPKKAKVGHEDVNMIDQLCTDGKRLTTVDPEEWLHYVGRPDSAAVEISVVLRLPDGRRETIKLFDTSPLKVIFLFTAGLGFAACDHQLVLSFPKREYQTTSAEKTLRELQFQRQELIHVEKK